MKRLDIKKCKITFIIISVCINFIISISILSNSIKGIGKEIGENECVNNIGLVISETIYNSSFNKNDILIFEYQNSKLSSISFDNYTINKYVALLNINILNYIKENNIKYDVPLLHNSSNIVIKELSPKVPILYTLLGNVIINSESIITSYGINNALIEVNMYILLNMKMILPFKSEVFSINREVTLVSKIIQGDIPSMYYGSNGINTVIPVK